jgi:DNA gyrase inhibitor GyrI/DNA-binding transcriptional MerR regulator
MYREDSVLRLRQTVFLRNLRIPLKQISRIFSTPDTQTLLDVLIQSTHEITDEITALSTMRIILEKFISELRTQTEIPLKTALFSDKAMLDVIDSLSLTKINFKEEKSMDNLNKAHEELSKLKNVRIVQLPPFTVASYHFIGADPEETVGEVISKFCLDTKLYEVKPDARMFGFNHPNPSVHSEYHGYEDWVTIPDDLEVPAPLVKKQFQGGLYAVHNIKFPNFHEWRDLSYWVANNNKYEPNYSPEGTEIMDGCLEEHVNWVYANHLGWPDNFIDGQLDLYCPVKLKANSHV